MMKLTAFMDILADAGNDVDINTIFHLPEVYKFCMVCLLSDKKIIDLTLFV